MSIDFKDDPRSAIVDAPSTMVVDDTQVKIWPGTTTSGATSTAWWNWHSECARSLAAQDLSSAAEESTTNGDCRNGCHSEAREQPAQLHRS